MTARHSFLVVAALLLFAVELDAQPNHVRGFDADRAYQVGQIDSVNVFTGNLIVTLPITSTGSSLPVGGSFEYGLTLVYNGQAWMFRQELFENNDFVTEALPNRFANAGLGWQLTLGELLAPGDILAGGSWRYIGPDGAERIFTSRLHKEEENTPYMASVNPPVNGVAGYTTDGSYLRLIRLGRMSRVVVIEDPITGEPINVTLYTARYRLEFPDGAMHTFKSEEWANATDPAYEKNVLYYLEKIEDRFGNWIEITTSSLQWIIRDSVGREHTVNFSDKTFYEFRGGTQSRKLVTSVVLDAFGGSTSAYTFSYSDYVTISEHCADEYGNGTSENPTRSTKTRFLESLELPDGTKHQFDYVRAQTDANGKILCLDTAGHMTKLELPTGGRIEYDPTLRAFPAAGQGDSPFDKSVAVAKRRLVDRDGTIAEWQYDSAFGITGTAYVGNPPTSYEIGMDLVVWIKNPLGERTAHYFNAYRDGTTTCYPQPDIVEYGLPYTRAAATGQDGRFLSSETFPAACSTFERTTVDGCSRFVCKSGAGAVVQPVRREYVLYEHDTGSGNARLRAKRTSFVDDSPYYIESAFEDFDGLGHYRRERRRSNIPGTTERVLTTHFNANVNAGEYVPSGSSVPANYMVAPADPWILGLHDYVSTTQDSVTARTDVCFERSTGFIERKWTRRGSVADDNDFLAVFTRDTSGNLTTEEFYGGDLSPLQSLTTCSEDPGTPEYTITHTWSNGVLATSQYSGTTFKTLDLTIDRSTGLPSESRDSAGLETAFDYDTMGHLVELGPPDEARTEYGYSMAANPPSISVKRSSLDATPQVLTEQNLYYDGFGRLVLQKTRMPNRSDGAEQWSTVHTTYDLLGRRSARSAATYRSNGDWEVVSLSNPTSTTYDRFGRTANVITPDGKSTTMTYTGARQMTRTSTVATGWELLPNRETEVSTRESYDGHGRLTSVTENSGSQDGALTTSYTYDLADRLVSVTASTQVRTFVYDAAGMLLSERVPEKGSTGNGDVRYTKYDSRGHLRARYEGVADGPFDLAFTYDAAERLTHVTEPDPTSAGTPKERRNLKVFTYATVNTPASCTSGNCDAAMGKLSSAQRTHYTADLGNVSVTESYEYTGRGGRIGQLDTAIGGTASFSGANFTWSQTWDDLGLPDTLTYPTTSAVSAPARTVDHTFAYGFLTKLAPDLASSITYQANGLMDTVTHGSGAAAVRETWAVDPHGMVRPASITGTGPAGVLWTCGDYKYDGAGNVMAIGNRSYRYDAFGRLASWTDQTPAGAYATTSRAYDRWGNYLYETHQACDSTGTRCATTNVLPHEVDATNHYGSMTYDAAGNVLSNGKLTASYDALSMMASTSVSGREFRHLYNADDERIALVERLGATNRTTWTIRDTGGNLLRTFVRNGGTWSWKEDEIWRGAQLLASITADGTRHVTLDHLGSPRLFTNGLGVKIGEQRFAPFGAGGTSDGGLLQFTGHERDAATAGAASSSGSSSPATDGPRLKTTRNDVETHAELPDYFHARFYDPGMGRFLSVDPAMDVERNLRTPQRWNRYAYALNNPIKYVDPDGLTERTGWQAGVVVNKSNQVVWIAADRNNARIVIPLRPGERSTSFLRDTDAVIIGPGQTIDGKSSGAFKIGSSDVDVEGKSAGNLELDVDSEWVVNTAAGRAGHVSPATARQNGWVIPAGQQGAQAAEKTKQQLQQEREREKQKNKPQPQPQPKPQPKKERDWWPFW